jgi:hypothetical protein
MQRSGRIKPKRRTSEEFQRIYGGADRVEWMQRQPCFVVALQVASRPCFGAIQCAHTITGGMSRKADAQHTVPACVSHHADYDQHRKPFDDPEVRARVQRYAAEVDAAWLAALPHQRRTW